MTELSKDETVRARMRKIIGAVATGHGGLDGTHEAHNVIDLRDLPAPAPLEQALLHISRLQPGESCLVWTPRVPQMLLQRVAERSCRAMVESAPDGTALVYLERL